MSIKDLVNHPAWEEIEQKMDEKMKDLLLDLPTKTSTELIAIHALANKKAYELLDSWLKDMGFYKGEDKPVKQRTYN